MPADTPTNTREEFFARSAPVSPVWPPIANAIDTYRGWNAAGSTRHTSSTSKFDAKIAATLHTENTPSDRSMTCLRFIFENRSGMVGPAIATMSANPLTSSPASGTLTPKRSATCGMIPTTPISVLRMPNTPTARMNMRRLLEPFAM